MDWTNTIFCSANTSSVLEGTTHSMGTAEIGASGKNEPLSLETFRPTITGWIAAKAN